MSSPPPSLFAPCGSVCCIFEQSWWEQRQPLKPADKRKQTWGHLRTHWCQFTRVTSSSFLYASSVENISICWLWNGPADSPALSFVFQTSLDFSQMLDVATSVELFAKITRLLTAVCGPHLKKKKKSWRLYLRVIASRKWKSLSMCLSSKFKK